MTTQQRNRLRALLDEGKGTLGTHVFSAWSGMTEVIGATGTIDYVEFSSTYAPFDLHDLDHLVLAAERHNMSSMIKIDPEPVHFLAQRAILAGYESILFADLRTPDQVADAIRTVRAEPKGVMGCAGGRARDYRFSLVSGADRDFVKYCDDLVVAIMLEKKSLIDRLEDVMNLDGVDMVQYGPCDYAMTENLHGLYSHERVIEVERKIIKLGLKYDKHPRVELGGDKLEAKMQRYGKLGVNDFSIETDVGIVYKWLKDNGTVAMKLMGR